MSNLAIISDIHGNCTALDAVLADLARNPASRLSAWAMPYREDRSRHRLSNACVSLRVLW